jgi:hypothetical protein
MIDFRGPCRRHRVALEAHVLGSPPSEATDAAFDHVDRCDHCRAELESMTLTVMALRRLGDDVATVRPAADAWPRLRARVAGWSTPGRPAVMSPLLGMALSLAIVVGSTISLPALLGDDAGGDRVSATRSTVTLTKAEIDWLRARSAADRRPAPVIPMTPDHASERTGPDGWIVTSGRREERRVASV